MESDNLRHIYFVRHGQTEWNATSRMQGQMNSDLNALGRKQVDINARLLASLGIQTWFCSPLDRTRQTAEIIQSHVAADVTFDDRIKEWDCGDWSGHLYADLKTKWPDEWTAFEADRFNYRGPNCENYPDMIRRATPFVRELLDSPVRKIAVISHGLIGRVMIGTLLGYSDTEMMTISQPNDVIYLVSLRMGCEEPGRRTLHHFIAPDGPFPGTVETW